MNKKFILVFILLGLISGIIFASIMLYDYMKTDKYTKYNVGDCIQYIEFSTAITSFVSQEVIGTGKDSYLLIELVHPSISPVILNKTFVDEHYHLIDCSIDNVDLRRVY